MSSVDDAREIIVVLGGGLLADGSPDSATLRRAAAATALALATPDAVVIASGGGPLPSEPKHAAASARLRGPEAGHIARILREGDGQRPRSLTLVNFVPFHAQRARWAFVRALPGWKVTVHPSAGGPEDVARLRPSLRVRWNCFSTGSRAPAARPTESTASGRSAA